MLGEPGCHSRHKGVPHAGSRTMGEHIASARTGCHLEEAGDLSSVIDGDCDLLRRVRCLPGLFRGGFHGVFFRITEITVEQNVIRFKRGSRRHVFTPPYSHFVYELPRKLLKNFPVMLQFGKRNRFVGW
jgi:hypothetical protein